MSEKKNISRKASGLRKRAEKIDQRKTSRGPGKIEKLSPVETQRVLHDLRVHQIELEMQNEELRTSQNKLDAERARYFDLYDLAPVGYCTISEEELIKEANLTAANLLGMSRGLLVRQPFSRFIFKEDQDTYYLHHKQLLACHPTDLANSPQFRQEASVSAKLVTQGAVVPYEAARQVAEQAPQSFELRMIKKDGTVFWVNLKMSATHDTDGTPVCRAVISDITEHKQIEGEIIFLSSITRNISDSIIVTDTNFGIVYVNKAAEQLFGYKLDEVKGKTPDIFNVAPMATLTQLQVYKTVSSGKIYEGESLNRRKDGSTFYCEYRAMPLIDDNGEIIAFLGIQRDITRRKRMENELKKNQELSNALFEYNPIETIVVDREGRVVTFNMRKRNSGDKLPQIGNIMYKDYAGKHKCDMHAELMKCMSTGEIREFPDLKYADKFLTVTIAPFPDGAIITSIDVTDRKNSENLLDLAYRKLDLAHNKLLAVKQSELLAFTGRIAAGIAHEIRNPSTTISLSLDQLFKTLKLKEPQAKYAEIIYKNVNRINYLINEMLNCARPPKLNMKPYDIHELLNDMVESSAMKMSTMKIKLTKEFTTANSVVKVDKEQIERVFLNLIINAIDAMSKKDSILSIVTENNGEYFLIKIGDTGKGIPEENIGKIFDPFFTTKTSGIGLGLTTCYAVVVSHGGTIEVSSNLSKGTVFTVSLPV